MLACWHSNAPCNVCLHVGARRAPRLGPTDYCSSSRLTAAMALQPAHVHSRQNILSALCHAGIGCCSSFSSPDGTALCCVLPRSMRKTKLLLDAVLASGRRDVTFCALDLCQQSLEEALQALHGEKQPHLHLEVGPQCNSIIGCQQRMTCVAGVWVDNCTACTAGWPV